MNHRLGNRVELSLAAPVNYNVARDDFAGVGPSLNQRLRILLHDSLQNPENGRDRVRLIQSVKQELRRSIQTR